VDTEQMTPPHTTPGRRPALQSSITPQFQYYIFIFHGGRLPCDLAKNETYRRFDTILLFDESL
jgi:hypothetical protein